MKIGISCPAFAAFLLLGFTALADTAVANDIPALRGQLHKSNSKPIRRRRVNALTEAPLKETSVKKPVDDIHREAPVPKEETTKSPTGMKTKSPSPLKEDRYYLEEDTMKSIKTKSPTGMKTKSPSPLKEDRYYLDEEDVTKSMKTKSPTGTKTKSPSTLKEDRYYLEEDVTKSMKTKSHTSMKTKSPSPLKEDRYVTKSPTSMKTKAHKGESISLEIGQEDREAHIKKKKRSKESYSYSTSMVTKAAKESDMSMSNPTKLKKKHKGSASSLSLGYLLVKQRQVPTTNLQKCLKPKVDKDVKKPAVKEAVVKEAVLKEAAVKDPKPLKQAAKIEKDPELEPTNLATVEEVQEDRSGIRRREQVEIEDASPKLDTTVDTVDAVDEVDTVVEVDTVDENDTVDEADETEEFEPFADFDIICDEDGNLLEGETWAPTMAPIDDEDLIDSDGDGITDVEEELRETDPELVDSDGDGLTDLQEVFLGTDPLNADTDGDGYSDGEEVTAYSNPLNPNITPDITEFIEHPDDSPIDSDGDGLSDEDEVNIFGTDPHNRDSDSDGLSDYDEVLIHGTDPNNPDSDGDGIDDSTEVQLGFDPLAPATNDKATPSPGCDAFAREKVFKTRIPARVQFEYEVAIDTTASINDINSAMENRMARLVGKQLINCDSARRLDGEEDAEALGHRYLSQHRHLLVDGVDSTPEDIVTSKPCKFFTASNEATPENSKCYTIRSFMTLYLREDSVLTSKLQSSSKALKAVLTAFNVDSPSPFLGGQGGEFSVEGLKAVRYMHGQADDGIKYAPPVHPSTKSGPSNPFARPLIIILLCVGAILLLIAIAFFVVTREKKQVTEEVYAEFEGDGFGGELDEKHHGGEEQSTDEEADSLSNNSPPQMVFRSPLDEGDSVFTGLEDDGTSTADEAPRSSPAFIRDEGSHSGFESVPDAPRSSPPFIRDEGSHSRFESVPEAPRSSPAFIRDEGSHSGFEYVPTIQAEQPNYENPAKLDSNGRPYRAENTIVL